MTNDLCITNGSVVTEAGVINAHIVVKGGKIVALIDAREDIPPCEHRIEARGLYVFPGGIDPHCHLWEPGETHREGWTSGSKAAAAGGITTVIEMPLNTPPTVNRTAFLEKKSLAEQKSCVDFGIWGGIIPESLNDLDNNINDLEEVGAAGYKVFMCWAAQKYPPIEDGLLYRSMKELSRKNLLIGIHAENESIIQEATARLKALGRSDPLAFAESRPIEAEIEAISRAITLGRLSNARMHIVHMGIADGAEIIKQAKQQGHRLTVETCPQYLTLDLDDLCRKGVYAKCAPPLRSRDNVERLWKYVLAGTIDSFGSDHAPFTREEKESATDFWEVPNGISGMQESFSLLIDEGVHKRGLTLNRLANMISTNTARIFGLYPQKGAIRIGSDADFALINLEKEWEINQDWLYYACKWSPYVGKRVRGYVVSTIVRGQEVYSDGEILVNPGYGQFVRPGLN